jgi:isopenicillin N synthase-like dioxygenase
MAGPQLCAGLYPPIHGRDPGFLRGTSNVIVSRIVADDQYLTNSVNRRLLTLFSRVLELDDDYLWNNVQSHVEGSATGEGYFRHAIFRPVEKATQEAAKGLKMHGHTDFGLTTLLFSVPISCLQIWKDDQWVYVPYKPGCLVVNIGETLEIVSGGHFKATKHRVYKPPADQAHEERLSIVQFNSSVGDLRMTPAAGEYPVNPQVEDGLTIRISTDQTGGMYRRSRCV